MPPVYIQWILCWLSIRLHTYVQLTSARAHNDQVSLKTQSNLTESETQKYSSYFLTLVDSRKYWYLVTRITSKLRDLFGVTFSVYTN